MTRSRHFVNVLKNLHRGFLAATLCVMCSCSSAPSTEDAAARTEGPSATPPNLNEPTPEAISLLGQPLFAPELSSEIRAKRERDLQNAQYEYDRTLHDENAIIWLGRRLAYLGRYNDAIDAFSNGLAIYPDSFKLLRHRGHRYITIRKFDLAIADLEKAATLIEDGSVPDEIEPDGQPNRLNIPTSSSHTNVYYHLGLAHYLKGDFDQAERAWRKCIEFSQTDDMRVAASYWLYLSLRRLHNEVQAAAVLRDIRPDMDIIENISYHRLMLFFKGDVSEEQILFEGPADAPSILPDVDIATVGYGVGAWHLFKGESEIARAQFDRVIAQSNWAAFGHIAAEAELALRDKLPTN